jgi:cysteine desulfurase
MKTDPNPAAQIVYLDHAASTRVRPEVLEAMLPFFGERFGNPSSAHLWGREARAALEEARERIAHVLGARRSEIVFTSGGTEADNIAVLGRARAAATSGQPAVLACSAIEHKAVLAAVKAAAHESALPIIIAVDNNGVIDMAALELALEQQPAVIAVMWVNNEVGSVQPIAEIAARCAQAGVPLHTDAIQAFGRVPVELADGITSLAVSGHKLGAPKGIGALFVRSGLSLAPTLHGGAQERGVRPGTENIAYAIGLSVAIELAASEQAAEATRLRGLRDMLQHKLQETIPDLVVNAAGAPRAPHILNVSLRGVEQDALLVSLDLEGIAVSTASACQSGASEPSHVLVAMGRGADDEAALRMSLGRTTTEAEIEYVGRKLPAIVERIRSYAHA